MTPDRGHTCELCGGTGSVPRSGKECPDCDTCVHCDGTGLNRFTGKECPDCHGTGRREEEVDPEEIGPIERAETSEEHLARLVAPPAWLEEPTEYLEREGNPLKGLVDPSGLPPAKEGEATNADRAENVIWRSFFGVRKDPKLKDRLLDQFDKLISFGPKVDIPRKGPCFRCLSDTKVRMRVIGTYGPAKDPDIEGPGLVDFLARFGGPFLGFIDAYPAIWLLREYGGVTPPFAGPLPGGEPANRTMTIWLYFCTQCHTAPQPKGAGGTEPDFRVGLEQSEQKDGPWLFWSDGKALDRVKDLDPPGPWYWTRAPARFNQPIADLYPKLRNPNAPAR